MSSSSCERAVLLVNSSFSRDRSRKRHEKRAAGRSFLHNLIKSASMVRTATLNMQLGALRDQQQLWENCFLHNLIKSASMVRTATLNMQLGALRDQQQLWENCFLQMFVCRRLWKDASPLKRRKQPNVRAQRARLGSK